MAESLLVIQEGMLKTLESMELKLKNPPGQSGQTDVKRDPIVQTQAQVHSEPTGQTHSDPPNEAQMSPPHAENDPQKKVSLEINRKEGLPKGVDIPKFESHKLLSKFRITKEQEYFEGADFRKLIPTEEFDKFKGRFLGAGFEQAYLIADYQKYHELKQEYFLKWILNNDYFSKVEQNVYKKPDFISFGGRISEPLQSPLKTRFGEWKIYAARFNDCIYLWDEKTSGHHQHTKESFYGVGFGALLTGQDPEKLPFNEFERDFVIKEVTFGDHQLLVLNEIDAMDSDGQFVEISCTRKCSFFGMRSKYLKNWAQNVVPGVESFIFGERDDEGKIQEINKFTMDVLRSKSGSQTDINRCLDFQNRLLTWIKEQFETNDPKIVKKFNWSVVHRQRIRNVRCKDVPEAEIPKAFLPKWYVEPDHSEEPSVTFNENVQQNLEGQGDGQKEMSVKPDEIQTSVPNAVESVETGSGDCATKEVAVE